MFISNSDFTQNSAIYGGVIASEFEAQMFIQNCNFYENFGFFGGVARSGMDGGMTINGGNLYENKALASLIAEFHDSTFS